MSGSVGLRDDQPVVAQTGAGKFFHLHEGMNYNGN